MTTNNVAKMTPEQLRDELAIERRMAMSWYSEATKCKHELIQRDRKHKNNVKMIEVRGKELGKVRADLAQARTELKDLQGANRAYGRQLANMRGNREFWYKEAHETWAELDAKAAKLMQARAELAAVDESLGEFYCPVLDPKTEEPCGSFWKDHGVHLMKGSLDHAEAALILCAKALAARQTELDAAKERLATLDAAEKALGQMREHAEHLSGQLQIAETGERAARKMLARAIVAEADAELAGHAALQAERRLRQEAERVCEAMSEMARDRGARLGKAEQDRKHLLRTDSTQNNYIEGLRDRLKQARQRAERAEALAQLVNEETAGLLDRLGAYAYAAATDYKGTPERQSIESDAWQSRELAAQIREALDDSQA